MKQFLKPTKQKIILTIILTILFTISFFISGLGVNCEIAESCFDKWYNSATKIISYPNYFFTKTLSFNNPPTYLILIILTNIIISYLVSCLIILTYNKLKTKQQTKPK